MAIAGDEGFHRLVVVRAHVQEDVALLRALHNSSFPWHDDVLLPEVYQ